MFIQVVYSRLPILLAPFRMEGLNLQEIHDFARDLAIRAGDQLKNAALSRTEVQASVDKDSQVDVVTQADLGMLLQCALPI